jgi:prephenate dehydrogenase
MTHSASPGSESSPVTVAIVGLGLLGGSLGLALKRLPAPCRVLGLARRQQSIDQALSMNAIDNGSTKAEDVLPEADITIVCLPVAVTIDFIKGNAGLWRKGAVVTDVGSIKSGIVEAGEAALTPLGIHFVGSHPMAGSEKSGLDTATAELYRDAVVFVTKTAATSDSAASRIIDMWTRVGSTVHDIELGAHDTLVAHTSHFLHLISPAAMNVALAPENAVLGTAGGFRDMTRIAASSPQMWIEIFQQNKDRILECVDAFQTELKTFSDAVRDENWERLEALLTQAREKRLEWESLWRKSRED